jgi:hypothetical protein
MGVVHISEGCVALHKLPADRTIRLVFVNYRIVGWSECSSISVSLIVLRRTFPQVATLNI